VAQEAAALGVLLVAIFAVSGSAAADYSPPPAIPWETVLPPLPAACHHQFHGVVGCRVATMACLDTEIERRY
jgi:hypothetical protein